MVSNATKKIIRNEWRLRALTAYRQSGEQKLPTHIHYTVMPGEMGMEGLHYVWLYNKERWDILAVYRITNRGALKRLRRWPRRLPSFQDSEALLLNQDEGSSAKEAA